MPESIGELRPDRACRGPHGVAVRRTVPVLLPALAVAAISAALLLPGRTALGAPITNRAEQEAAKRPPFRMADPVGPVFTDGQKALQREAGAALVRQIAAARADGRKRLTIAPGDYRFGGNRGLTLSDLRDLTIEAAGATFWFERSAEDVLADPQGLRLERCRRLAIHGLTIDFDPLLTIQARILSLDVGADTLEVEADEAFPIVDALGPGQMIAYRADGSMVRQPVMTQQGVQRIAGNRLRVKAAPGLLRRMNEDAKLVAAWKGATVLRPGDYLAIVFRRGASITLEQCDRTRLEDVNVYASPGMGILESGGPGGNVFRRVRIVRRPGTRRLQCGNADTFHSRLVERGPRIEECEFANNADDMVNLHGFFALVCRRLGPNRLVVMPMEYDPFRVGGKVSFWNYDTLASEGEARITAVKRLVYAPWIAEAKALPAKMGILAYRGDPYVVTLDRAVDAGERSMADVHAANASGFAIRDCYFHDSIGRATLINGASDGVIEGNVYRMLYGGVHMHMESWFYMEGPFPRDIIVRANRFDAVGGAVWGADQPVQGLIYAGMVPRSLHLYRSMPLSGIHIVGNQLERPPAVGILVAYARGVEIRGNEIVEPQWLAAATGADVGSLYYGKSLRSAIAVVVSDEVEIAENRIIDPNGDCKDGAVDLGPNVTRARVDGKPAASALPAARP